MNEPDVEHRGRSHIQIGILCFAFGGAIEGHCASAVSGVACFSADRHFCEFDCWAVDSAMEIEVIAHHLNAF